MHILDDLVDKQEVLKDKARQKVVSPLHFPISHTLEHHSMSLGPNFSWLLLCPSGTSHCNPFRNPPRKQCLVGRRQQGRCWTGASLTQGWHTQRPRRFARHEQNTKKGPERNSFPSPSPELTPDPVTESLFYKYVYFFFLLTGPTHKGVVSEWNVIVF